MTIGFEAFTTMPNKWQTQRERFGETELRYFHFRMVKRCMRANITRYACANEQREKGTNFQHCHSLSFYDFYSFHFEYNQNKSSITQTQQPGFAFRFLSAFFFFAFFILCWLNDFKWHFVATIEHFDSMPFAQWIHISNSDACSN